MLSSVHVKLSLEDVEYMSTPNIKIKMTCFQVNDSHAYAQKAIDHDSQLRWKISKHDAVCTCLDRIFERWNRARSILRGTLYQVAVNGVTCINKCVNEV